MEPQEYSRNIIGKHLPRSLYILFYSYYILGVPCSGFRLESFYGTARGLILRGQATGPRLGLR